MLTVTTPAADRSLLTIEELRDAVNVSDSDLDSRLATLGARVAASLAKMCGMDAIGTTPPTFRLETLTEVFRDVCAPHLWLARSPVVSVASVVTAGSTVDAENYEIDGRRLYSLSSDARVWWSGAKITVVYDAGWAEVPDDLKTAAAKMARLLWAEDGPGGRADPNLKRVRVEGMGEREWWVGGKDDPLANQEILDLLGPYREVII